MYIEVVVVGSVSVSVNVCRVFIGVCWISYELIIIALIAISHITHTHTLTLTSHTQNLPSMLFQSSVK